MIGSYIITDTELNTVVPKEFYLGEDENLIFKDYAHYMPFNSDKFIIFIGRKIGECYDSNATNRDAWTNYFQDYIGLDDDYEVNNEV